MEAEESNGGEFQEKTGLKRKLTGPPRLLLGKSKSPGQDEKSEVQALRKQRRDKNNTAEEPQGTAEEPQGTAEEPQGTAEEPQGMAEEHQGNNETDCESQRVMCQNPETALTIEGEETHTDVREESLEAVTTLESRTFSKQQGKKHRMRRRRAKATIRRVFSPAFTCVKRRKELEVTSAEDAEDKTQHKTHISLKDILTNDNTPQELQTLPGDPITTTERNDSHPLKKDSTKKGRKKFCVRMWPIFRRLSVMSSSKQRQEKGCDNTFIEIASENSMPCERSHSNVSQSDCCAPEPSGDEGIDEQLKGSSEIQEDIAKIHKKGHPENDLDHKEGGAEKVTLNAELSADLSSHENDGQTQSPNPDVCKLNLPEVKDVEGTKREMIEISEPTGLLNTEAKLTCVNESSSAIKDSEEAPDIASTDMIAVNDLNDMASVEQVQSKPVITIEDVHSSDEENQESIEYGVPRCDLLSTVFSMNGSCHHFKVNSMRKYTLQAFDQSNHNSQVSEILLMQTAISLVNTAISGAVEQLTAELQNNQLDQDHA